MAAPAGFDAALPVTCTAGAAAVPLGCLELSFCGTELVAAGAGALVSGFAFTDPGLSGSSTGGSVEFCAPGADCSAGGADCCAMAGTVAPLTAKIKAVLTARDTARFIMPPLDRSQAAAGCGCTVRGADSSASATGSGASAKLGISAGNAGNFLHQPFHTGKFKHSRGFGRNPADLQSPILLRYLFQAIQQSFQTSQVNFFYPRKVDNHAGSITRKLLLEFASKFSRLFSPENLRQFHHDCRRNLHFTFLGSGK